MKYSDQVLKTYYLWLSWLSQLYYKRQWKRYFGWRRARRAWNTRSNVLGTADCFFAGVRCHMLKSLQRDMGLENATKKGHVKEFCHKKLTTTGLVSGRTGQCVREGRDGHEDWGSDCRTQEHKLGWHLFDRSNLTFGRQERLLGAAEGGYDFAAIECARLGSF